MGDNKLGIKAAESNNTLSVMVESRILDCHVCSKPLQSPISRCGRHHFLCHECAFKNSCCTCYSHLVKSSLLDTVVQSITISCSYYSAGCREKVQYSDKLAHEDSCEFNPYCFCPSKYCTFKCRPIALSSHLILQHSEICFKACYGEEFFCIVQKDLDYQVVVGEDHRSFLLLTEHNVDGTYVTFVCMGPKSFADDLCYEIRAESDVHTENTVLSLKTSRMICIRKLMETRCRRRSLFLPSEVFDPKSEIYISICITKK